MARCMTNPIYKGMRLAREDRTKNRMPSLELIEEQKRLKKLRKKRKKGS